MKRAFFLIAGTLLAFTSCKKDRTCTCKYTDSDGGTYSYSGVIAKETKKNAKEKCEGESSSYSYGGYTSTTTCTLD
tara:strand:+ start:725 stop:952 length:228 start_codon:yes stop_codon:yes gene_type:complete